MPHSQVSLDAGGSRWTLSVPQAQRKLPLKFVPSQTCGNFVALQIWMTGVLFVLVAMQVSKTARCPDEIDTTCHEASLASAEDPWR